MNPSLIIKIIKGGEHLPSTELVFKDAFSIGREQGNAIYLTNQLVSRQHAKVVIENGSWFFIDNSTNGSFDAGERIGKLPLSGVHRLELGKGGPVLEFEVEKPALQSDATLIAPAFDPDNMATNMMEAFREEPVPPVAPPEVQQPIVPPPLPVQPPPDNDVPESEYLDSDFWNSLDSLQTNEENEDEQPADTPSQVKEISSKDNSPVSTPKEINYSQQADEPVAAEDGVESAEELFSFEVEGWDKDLVTPETNKSESNSWENASENFSFEEEAWEGESTSNETNQFEENDWNVAPKVEEEFVDFEYPNASENTSFASHESELSENTDAKKEDGEFPQFDTGFFNSIGSMKEEVEEIPAIPETPSQPPVEESTDAMTDVPPPVPTEGMPKLDTGFFNALEEIQDEVLEEKPTPPNEPIEYNTSDAPDDSSEATLDTGFFEALEDLQEEQENQEPAVDWDSESASSDWSAESDNKQETSAESAEEEELITWDDAEEASTSSKPSNAFDTGLFDVLGEIREEASKPEDTKQATSVSSEETDGLTSSFFRTLEAATEDYQSPTPPAQKEPEEPKSLGEEEWSKGSWDDVTPTTSKEENWGFDSEPSGSSWDESSADWGASKPTPTEPAPPEKSTSESAWGTDSASDWAAQSADDWGIKPEEKPPVENDDWAFTESADNWDAPPPKSMEASQIYDWKNAPSMIHQASPAGDQVMGDAPNPAFQASPIKPTQNAGSVTGYVKKFEDGNAEGMGSRTQMMMQAFTRMNKKSKRNLYIIIGVVVGLLLVALVYALLTREENVQQSEVIQTQQTQISQLETNINDLYYQIKDWQLKFATDSTNLESNTKEINDARTRLDEMARQRSTYKNLSEEEKLIFDITRLFGENDVAMPRAYVDSVKKYIGYWKGSNRYINAITTAKQNGYMDLIVRTFLEEGVPPQFFYLCLQESNFNTKIVGPPTRYGHAKGMWQFIQETGKKYGLHPGPSASTGEFDPLDERHNAQKATIAAAKYISYIYKTDAQASGLLVMASYNWGEGNVINRVRKMPNNPRERNFWTLNTQHWMPDETRKYVYYIVSAAVIGENPRLFGFNFENPLEEAIKNHGGGGAGDNSVPVNRTFW